MIKKSVLTILAVLLAGFFDFATAKVSSETVVEDLNRTYSPDSTKVAFTRLNDLYVEDVATGKVTRLTFDGTDLILNGYASWVYYEEIFGRPSKYKAFWWSPDSEKLAFYRFDNTQVPLFPIYSPFGQGGSLNNTRYPKAGQRNPEVRIGLIDLSEDGIVWADFDETEDQYFGTPFWSDDSRRLYVQRMPRIQNTLDLYAVAVEDGSKTAVYHEEYKPSWLDWINGMLFTPDGLYMVRSFETGWQQIYFLGYDGSLNRLTDGPNWSIQLLRADHKKGDVYFIAKRDATVRPALYVVDKKGEIKPLTDPAYYVHGVKFSEDGKTFEATYSNSRTPHKTAIFDVDKIRKGRASLLGKVIDDTAPEGFDPSKYALPEIIYITTEDGFRLPASIVYPLDFDPSKKYPVHMDIYGGPNTPMVRDRWVAPSEDNQWWSKNGIIQITCDCRAAGHNGRAGLDMIYKNLSVKEVDDFVEWAKYLQSLPYVQADKIGVEGFSFGGTMTTMLLCRASEYFHYGIAGGGVYDWSLYDTHYTERFMETPQTNPEGYKAGCALNYVDQYPVDVMPLDSDWTPEQAASVSPVMLKITHGTGDDNVHFQSTLQLIDALHKAGKRFEYMSYPDGMHGYRGYQGLHFENENRLFWLKYLKNGSAAASSPVDEDVVSAKPITGSFINLAYQDVRNKYTNLRYDANTDPALWECKVEELHQMGVEYLVFMAVANEGKAFYPSALMPRCYPQERKSPVDAIMDAAANRGMKVFMSTGWAKDQDDNLRDPKIKARQIEMMTELAGLYGSHPALYGWYLPVEDCLGPVLSDYAVEAVNALTDRAKELTPGKKVLVSPYGIFNSDFDHPSYAKQIGRLKVDIIAYQDEVGCVREEYPLVRLRENWKKLREIHDGLDIELWANCETFAWEKGTNSRSSALVPAAYSRLLAQQVAATECGKAEEIVSFMVCGIYEKPCSPYQLGQPVWSNVAYNDYMSWLGGDRYWKLMEAGYRGDLKNGLDELELQSLPAVSDDSRKLTDSAYAQESADDAAWVKYPAGLTEIVLPVPASGLDEVMVRMLNYAHRGVRLPDQIALSVCDDIEVTVAGWKTLDVASPSLFPNVNHDSYIDAVYFDLEGNLKSSAESLSGAKYIKLSFYSDTPVYIDEVLINPVF